MFAPFLFPRGRKIGGNEDKVVHAVKVELSKLVINLALRMLETSGINLGAKISEEQFL